MRAKHEWNKKQLGDIAKQIRNRKLQDRLVAQDQYQLAEKLPRLLFLTNFWAKFYLVAKYGFEDEYLAAARDLFDKGEAELAVHHAKECYQAAELLSRLDEHKLDALVSHAENE